MVCIHGFGNQWIRNRICEFGSGLTLRKRYGVDKKMLIAGLVLFSAIGIAPPAYAYLDPGTGSMPVQMLLGGVAGAFMVGKLCWHRTMTSFGRRPPKMGTKNSKSRSMSIG